MASGEGRGLENMIESGNGKGSSTSVGRNRTRVFDRFRPTEKVSVDLA